MEGEIIKFYREKQNLTQAQLGEGICTTTHVSKIERGKTAYSEEMIMMFSDRLSIDIKQEVDKFKSLETLLQQWLEAIIMRRFKEMEDKKDEIERIPFIQSTYYADFYHLLKARHLIIQGERTKALELLEYVNESYASLAEYEKNLLFHTYGVYYISDNAKVDNESNSMPIHYLKKVNMEQYGNKEYYYHLAIAYHFIGSYIMAYFFAEKALHFFKETNNYAQSINAESVMLLQMSRDTSVDFDELVNRYKNLIHNSEILGLNDKRSLLLNNLGFEYFNKGEYALSKQCYKQALQIDAPDSNSYLLHLCNYIDACLEEGIYSKTFLFKKIKEGFSLAKKLKSTHFLIVLKLLKLKTENNTTAYFQFIEEKALPYFTTTGHIIYRNRYGKVLLNRYIESNQYMEATKVFSEQFLNKTPENM